MQHDNLNSFSLSERIFQAYCRDRKFCAFAEHLYQEQATTLFLVGGFVRDIALGIAPKDYDTIIDTELDNETLVT